MVFTVLAACQVHGRKVNYELEFAAPPSKQELEGRVKAVFGQELLLGRPPGVPPTELCVHRIQVYNESAEAWEDLLSHEQLTDGCQIYTFRREDAWHREVQSKIPPAERPPHLVPPPGSRQSPAVASPLPAALLLQSLEGRSPQPRWDGALVPSAPPPALPAPDAPCPAAAAASPHAGPRQFDEKVRAVFSDLGTAQSPYLSRDAWLAGFQRLGLEFPRETQEHLFMVADADKDGLVCFAEFMRFGELYPALLDALYQRGRDGVMEQLQRAEVDEAERAFHYHNQSAQILQRERQRLSEQIELQRREMGRISTELKGADADIQKRLEDLHAANQAKEKSANALDGQKKRVRDLADEAQRKQDTHPQKMVDDAQKAYQDAQGQVGAQEKRVAELEAQLEKARAELAQLRDMAEKKKGQFEDGKKQAESWAESVRQCEEDVKAAQGEQKAAEGALEAAAKVAEEAGAAHKKAVDDGGAKRRDLDAQDRRLAELEAADLRLKLEEEELKRVSYMQLDRMNSLRAQLEDRKRWRKQVCDSEYQILDKEVQLRAQRAALELEEQTLRDSHHELYSSLEFASAATRAHGAASFPAQGLLPPPPAPCGMVAVESPAELGRVQMA
eukprot:TRINITY_DN60867_c0_g1_i1.p1 TRINITY_DN60867_c0_g1~~TRINITY_DN60867_c0_g1_i1.p1  ORF type:complete len:644 (+),score=210.81 TRINITY_DN60867_c0_g1_i1:82-1932(+)